ncbi:YgiQ family radical SAM protein [Sphaerochaeta globosa]|uniref:Radical SAM domain protein n=1 Tax=Sphaerochaeta globosa (strain ATCC BAA-1886 / DSM 22777 / Buddy) TaxID=158189 RepID=F0RZU7_SPHGB|nr:YgiQ family radical SAM protein [Sphaerochaeta globosa]ADY14848.1 Radical SAM domain protein [Sphaerochaeta globosa str. Buddy]
MKTYAPRFAFLPTTQEDLRSRSWDQIDIAFISADAYVDHPSFGAALLARLLEKEGYRVGIIAQPDWNSTKDFLKMGKPRLCCMISGGNIDSMVSHYTANNKPRSEDEYSPGGKAKLRPDRPTLVYTAKARQAYGADIPLIIGGLEASLRRLSHYDFWTDKVRKPIILDAKADLLVYGMGEKQTIEIVRRLDKGEPIQSMVDIKGTVYATNRAKFQQDLMSTIEIPSFEEVSDRDKISNTPTVQGKQAYAEAFQAQLMQQNPIAGKRIVQACMERLVVQNPPALPLDEEQFDQLYELPFTLDAHPDYEKDGGVPALNEVQFSLTSNRGCFGSCSFCAITSHQGRMIQTRSKASLIKEAQRMAEHPVFKGYIHDLGGPTANFQGLACDHQIEYGPCPAKECLWPKPCSNLKDYHGRYLDLLQALESVKGVKKVFIRSGIRYDYLLEVCDQQTRERFMKHLVRNNVSGQLKVAPEHVSPAVLDAMGKPRAELFDAFGSLYQDATEEAGKKQYLIPYFIAAHPGSTLEDAITLALYLEKTRFIPDQVQEFYPTPGTVSTCMYYTGLDPRPGKRFATIRVPKGRERHLQRALLQYNKPENRPLVLEALDKANRKDLTRILLARRYTS